jgi:hypothetical protein
MVDTRDARRWIQGQSLDARRGKSIEKSADYGDYFVMV